jgi:hypothetical protein
MIRRSGGADAALGDFAAYRSEKMRIQFDVAALGTGWSVRRNGKVMGLYESQLTAIEAAENFARAFARHGDSAVVRLVDGGHIQEQRSFASDIF